MMLLTALKAKIALAILAFLGCCDLSHSAYTQTYTTTTVAHVRRPNHTKYVACYFQSWSIYRNGDGAFDLDKFRPEYCTHLIYSFAGLNATTFQIRSLDTWADLEDVQGKGGYKKLTKLRYQYPGLKVSLAVGGWNENSTVFSEMAKSRHSRQAFINSATDFLIQYGFHGLDLDWEFPRPHDRHNFIALIQELKQAFRERNLLLTAAISADVQTVEQRYDVRRLSDYLDYIHLMSYDYHVNENQVILPNSPYREVSDSVDKLLALGVRPEKLILGLPTYGRGYILTEGQLRSYNESPIGKLSIRESWHSQYITSEKPTGVFGYNEICKYFLTDNSWVQRWDNLSSTPFAVHMNKVIVYDSPKSLQLKVLLAMKKGLGGVLVWSIDTDDFRGDCAPHHRRRTELDKREYQYPLMQAITYALERGSSGRATVTTSLSAFMLFCTFAFTRLPWL